MSSIVQINFNNNSSQAQLEQDSVGAAPMFTDIPGLQWKVWIGNEQGGKAGGIYLFDNRQNAQAYADSELVQHLRENREDVTVEVFDILEQPTKLTAKGIPGIG